MQDNFAQVLVTPHISNINTSEDMGDQEPLPEDEEEEEEFIVLDPEHVCSFCFNICAISIY